MTHTFKKRLEKIRVSLQREKLGAFVALCREDDSKNIRYLTGFGGSQAVLAVGRMGAVLAVDGRYSERARKEVSACRIFDIEGSWQKWNSGPLIRHMFECLRVPPKTPIGYEGNRVSVLTEREWHKEFGKRLVPTKNLVEKLRQYKDAREIADLRHACRVTSNLYVQVARSIRPRMRESDIALAIDSALRKRGASGPSFPTIVASGPNAAIPHHETSERKVRAGEPVIMDFGGVFKNGYCSDLTRTIFVPGKKPHPKLARAYKVALHANKKAFQALAKGMTWSAYDACAREHIEQEGLGDYFLHGLGHSLGLEAHDPYDYRHDPIGEGVVLTDEPGVYIEGLGGIRIEDDIVITSRGPVRLTTAPYLSLP